MGTDTNYDTCNFLYRDANTGSDKPTNEYLLSTAFISFLSFTIVQSIAAYVAKSESMVGDSVAMAVDSFTYGFNLFAERMKNRADVLEAESQYQIRYEIKGGKEGITTSGSKCWEDV